MGCDARLSGRARCAILAQELTGRIKMRQQASRALFDYWNVLRRGKPAPERSQLRLQDLRDILAHTFLLDADHGRGFPLKVIGTRLEEWLVAPRLAAPFLEYWTPGSRSEAERVLLDVVEEATPVIVGARIRQGDERGENLELLFLPMRGHGDKVTRVLGGVAPGPLQALPGHRPQIEFISARTHRGPHERQFLRHRQDTTLRRDERPRLYVIEGRARNSGHV